MEEKSKSSDVLLYSKILVNCLRVLCADAVEQAKSGHPGAPLGMADMAVVLWKNFLSHHPLQPQWLNRDRFILSNGHASILLYSLLHLSGYSISIKDIKNFRQLGSKTPGHPEFDMYGVETTTGPLGQGFANAVGMAIAEKNLAAKYNRNNYQVIDHYTYSFVGDGDLMEGISHEAGSLAGTLGLEKLIVMYDDNRISIDGKVTNWMKDDTAERFRSYNWNVIDSVDGHNPQELYTAISQAKKETEKPTMIICKTIIGYGAPNKQDTADVHGAPLGADEITLLRDTLGWKHQPFKVPTEVYEEWSAINDGKQRYDDWSTTWKAYQTDYPELYEELMNRYNNSLSDSYQTVLKETIELFHTEQQAIATRASSQKCIEKFAPIIPGLLGGSADLSGSNLTKWSGSVAMHESWSGNYLHYGVREFAMMAIQNGLSLHGGFIPYAGTFLVFSDYCRNAIRLSAMMKLPGVYVFTHDSIGLGEDGPTHQPIEHLWALRLIPNLYLWRPADNLETLAGWHYALSSKNPTALALSRQKLAYVQDSHKTASDNFDLISKGGYFLRQSLNPEAILIATGSEVSSCIDVYEALKKEGIMVSVVSMPCVELFLQQSKEYQSFVLPRDINKKVAVEAGAGLPWKAIIGTDGLVCSIETFGASGKAEDVYKHFALDPDSLYNSIKTYIQLENKYE